MPTKEEVVAAIAAADERVTGLGPAMLANAQTPLVESEWDVRQALCHVAARANPVPLANMIMQRVRAAQAAGQPTGPRGSGRGNEINQGQLEERQDSSVPDLLNEIHAGHQAAILAVREMPQDILDQRLPRFFGEGDMSMAELLLLSGTGHETSHLDEIVKAIEKAE